MQIIASYIQLIVIHVQFNCTHFCMYMKKKVAWIKIFFSGFSDLFQKISNWPNFP